MQKVSGPSCRRSGAAAAAAATRAAAGQRSAVDAGGSTHARARLAAADRIEDDLFFHGQTNFPSEKESPNKLRERADIFLYRNSRLGKENSIFIKKYTGKEHVRARP